MLGGDCSLILLILLGFLGVRVFCDSSRGEGNGRNDERSRMRNEEKTMNEERRGDTRGRRKQRMRRDELGDARGHGWS